ncbi:MAG TPA: sigma-70 family RNA polymerase sigma factor [Chitinophagaceae bacterium]|jgi:RNA polymerase sigma-70 factor (ECF subfamily)
MENSQWSSILEGDKEAFLAFYRENYQSLFSYGYRICGNKELAKDSIQDMFLELWKSRKSVNPEVKSSLSYLMTWLRRVISRQLKTNAKHLNYKINPDDSVNEPAYEELLINQQNDENRKKQLQAALLQLTPAQLNIIQQRFFEKKSFQEIADENGLAKQTVYNVVYKALVILKKVIGDFYLIFLTTALPATTMLTHQFIGS